MCSPGPLHWPPHCLAHPCFSNPVVPAGPLSHETHCHLIISFTVSVASGNYSVYIFISLFIMSGPPSLEPSLWVKKYRRAKKKNAQLSCSATKGWSTNVDEEPCLCQALGQVLGMQLPPPTLCPEIPGEACGSPRNPGGWRWTPACPRALWRVGDTPPC